MARAVMIPQVGFSTRKNNAVSRAIRFFTGSRVSHVFIVYYDSYLQMDMVLEATDPQFHCVPFSHFKRENDIVCILPPRVDLTEGVKWAIEEWSGTWFDVAGLFGSLFVVVGRILRRLRILRKGWRNPFRSSKFQFCSEVVTRIMQRCKHPGMDDMDPESTQPEDLLVLLLDKSGM